MKPPFFQCQSKLCAIASIRNILPHLVTAYLATFSCFKPFTPDIGVYRLPCE
jgi:hypothetical protein